MTQRVACTKLGVQNDEQFLGLVRNHGPCLQHLLSRYSAGAQAIGHVVPSWPGFLCRGGGDSPQHQH